MLVAGSAVAAQAACPTAPASLVSDGTLTVGILPGGPPMGFLDGSQPKGFDIDLAAAIAEKMCLKVAYVATPFAGMFPAMDSKKYDTISASIGITDARKQKYDFVPVFKGGLRLVVNQNDPVRFKTESDVCGHAVALVAGSTQMAALERVKSKCPADKPMEMKVFTNQTEALNEVAKKAVSAAYVDWPLAAYVVQQRPNDFVEASPVLSGKGPNTQRNRNGLVVRKGETQMHDALAAAFDTVLADGEYDALLKKWNLTDGDIRVEND
ncbi:ABC transporter substrate-binding protein [Aureimonas sp. AU20]|uniref:ABC transporter substrate-binding protein n=1 Tax=Aureimonas sp. AU20 TaxID=1349819 RepID=UPI000785FCE3|nr:ABC transporter substrate-binding protein [Aureimonas sp. AU20]